MNVKKMSIVNIFQLAIIKILLEVLYVSFVHKFFEYAGFLFNFTIEQYILGWVVFFVASLFLYVKSSLHVIDMYIIFFILWFIPNIIYYSFVSHELLYLLILSVPYLVVVLFTFNLKLNRVNEFKFGRVVSVLLSLLSVFVVLVHFMLVSGGTLNFDVSKVYELRETFGQEMGVGLFGYLNSWAFKIFSVLLLAWSIEKKHRGSILFSIMLIVLLYGFSGHKSALVGIVLVPFFYFIYKRKNYISLISMGFITFLSLNLLLSTKEESMLWVSILVRRIFFIPTHLNYTYLEFFSVNPYYYWSGSSFQVFVSNNTYGTSLPLVIGSYLGSDTMAANTGFIASGFANAGYSGVFAYTIITTILMNFINLLATMREKYIVMAILILPVSSLFTSSDLPTSFLTHGILLAIFVLFLYGSKNYILKANGFSFKV